jgi:hypothetical protein
MDIVTAIFVSNVKILASIRLKGNDDNIRVKIPTSDIFIHSIYIEAAQQIFSNPYLFYHKNSFSDLEKSKEIVKRIIKDATETTIKNMLPFDNILQEYLKKSLDDNAEVSEDEDDSIENISDSDEESLDEDDLGGYEDQESEEEYEDDTKVINNNGIKQNTFDFVKDDESADESDDEPSSSLFNNPPVLQQPPVIQQQQPPIVQQEQPPIVQQQQPQVVQQQQTSNGGVGGNYSFF